MPHHKEKAHLSGGPIPNVVSAKFQASLIVQRDDGLWAIGWYDDAPGPFESRRFAEAVCGVCNHAPA